MEKNKAIFFDRDGVVNFRIVGNYIKSPDEMIIIKDFLEFFQYIKSKGYYAIMISNQQGIGKGIMTFDDLNQVHSYLQDILKSLTGFTFDDIFICPELAEKNSINRKPNPGMLLDAINKWNIDVSQSWMIGDRKSDVVAGKRAGVKTMLIGRNKYDEIPEADYKFNNLYEALKLF